jgi:hypothetical protein
VPVSSADFSAIEPPDGGASHAYPSAVNQVRLLAVLVGLFAVHAAVDGFLSPIGGGVALVDGWALVRVGTMGVVVVQPALVAIGAVSWPTRATTRVTVTLIAIILLAYAILFATARNLGSQIGIPHFATMLMQYFLFAGLLSLVARLRRWQMLPKAAPERFTDRQFSLYGLLGSVTAASLVFGLGNWVQPLAAWPNSFQGWQAHLDLALRTALVLSVPCLPVIPCLVAILAPQPRGRQIAWALGWVTATATAFSAVLISFRPEFSKREDIAVLVSIFLCGYGSAVFSLLMVRLCGLTLVRRPIGQRTLDDRHPPRNPAAVNLLSTLRVT